MAGVASPDVSMVAPRCLARGDWLKQGTARLPVAVLGAVAAQQHPHRRSRRGLMPAIRASRMPPTVALRTV
jgi:hypothetical protein